MSSSDKLFFYSKSAAKKAGKGAKEVVARPEAYAELDAMTARGVNWRKTLSNFHVCEFPFEDLRYLTIEHGFHAAKIALADP